MVINLYIRHEEDLFALGVIEHDYSGEMEKKFLDYIKKTYEEYCRIMPDSDSSFIDFLFDKSVEYNESVDHVEGWSFMTYNYPESQNFILNEI